MPGRKRAPALFIILAATLAAVLLAGCGAAPVRVRTPVKKSYFSAVREISLQVGDGPGYLTFDGHGNLWFTETGGDAVARINAAGQMTQYFIQPGNDNDPEDIISVPGGDIWFTGLEQIGKVSADGAMMVWNDKVGFPDALAAGPGGQVWYADDGGHICQVADSGVFKCQAIHLATNDISIRGLTVGPDGALWFTEDNLIDQADTQNAIGRLAAGGSYREWLLPPGSGPTRIAAGPDGALWFTERTSQRIGRITTSGVITQFALPPAVYPFDIVPGPDKSLWFTTDVEVGRITTAGRITLWPVPGAQELGGIAVAPDGSLWLTDLSADAIWHFIPPRSSSAVKTPSA